MSRSSTLTATNMPSYMLFGSAITLASYGKSVSPEQEPGLCAWQ